ncbi:MAG TPA: SCO family protein [Pyrinomonadaceae bacterium]|nr:SCO family protein [Pyrinomonadaceae bacterium]
MSAAVLALFLVSLMSACGGGGRGEERRYELKGKVVAVDRAKGEVTVSHEDIVGYMKGMTMEFPLRDADALRFVGVGDKIQATLVVNDREFWLENPVITREPDGASGVPATTGGTEPQPGTPVPDVKLTNQDGKPIHVAQFKGRALLVTFVYTRCPMPDQCPLMSMNFAQVNGALGGDPELKKRAHLLSVTLDPEYDKPEVLRSYGAAYAGGKFDDWDFATGDPAEVRRLAEFFGLMYMQQEGQLVHSLRTAVVKPDGTLYKIYRGNEWKPEDVLSDLRAAASGS